MKTEMYNRVASRVGRPALQLIGTNRDTITFFGGAPIASNKFEWPRKDGRPLSFIGQIDLSELDLAEAAPWLPASGRLLFFYDMDEWPWGFDPKDKGGWAVILDSGKNQLTEVPFPEDLKEECRTHGIKRLEGKPYLSIPSLERITLEEAGISEDQEDDYYELSLDAFEGNPLHQIGGFPEPVQGDEMEDECQLASGGAYCGNPEGYQNPKVDELRREENDWRLLLQFDSDDDLNLMWGDSGTIYFWVRERDARAGDFSNVWLVLQCC
jgi:uncharacterized protein YwqG